MKYGVLIISLLLSLVPNFASAQNTHIILSAGAVRVNNNPEKDKVTVTHRCTAVIFGPARITRIDLTTKVKIFLKFYAGSTLIADVNGNTTSQTKVVLNPLAMFDTSQIWNPARIRSIVGKISAQYASQLTGWTRVDYRYSISAQAKFTPATGAPFQTVQVGGQTNLYTLYP